MKIYKKTYTFSDYFILFLYNQVFWPNSLILIILLFFNIFLTYKNLLSDGLSLFPITLALDICMIYTILVLVNSILISFYYFTGLFRSQKWDEITFSDDCYTVANSSRELKFFWKEVKYCRMSDYQFILNNGNSVIYRLSKPGFTEEEWTEITNQFEEKADPKSLLPFTIGISIGLLIGSVGLVVWILKYA